MELRHPISHSGKTEGDKGVVEVVVVYPSDRSNLLERQAIEIRHLMAEMHIVLLIASLFRSMRGEDEPTFDLGYVAAVFLVQVENGGDGMCLVEVVDIWLEAQLIDQPGATNPQQDELGNLGCDVGIVEAVCDGL